VSLRSHRCHGTKREPFGFGQLSDKVHGSPLGNTQLISSTSNPSSPTTDSDPLFRPPQPSAAPSFGELGPGPGSGVNDLFCLNETSSNNVSGINLDSFVLLEADRLLGLRIDDAELS
jgi:hypothetical protein